MTPAPALSHYHRVDVFLWVDVRGFLEQLIVDALSCRPEPLTVCLDDSCLDALLSFLEQMQLGYVHPRSTSAFFRLSSSRRSAARSLSANPRMKKNLSPNVQENATICL